MVEVMGIPISYVLEKIIIYKSLEEYDSDSARYHWKEIVGKDLRWKAVIRMYCGHDTFIRGFYHFKGKEFLKLVSDRGFEPIPPEWIIDFMEGKRNKYFREKHIRVIGIFTENEYLDEDEEMIPYILIIDYKNKKVYDVGYYRTDEYTIATHSCKHCFPHCNFNKDGTVPLCIKKWDDVDDNFKIVKI